MLVYGCWPKLTAFAFVDDLFGGRLSRLYSRVGAATYVVFTRHSLSCTGEGCACLSSPWWVEQAVDYTVPGAVPVTPVLPRCGLLRRLRPRQ